MSAHLTAPSPVLPLVLHLRSTLALAEATRAADRALMGRYIKPNLLRDTLVRLILLEHEEGRAQHIAFYQQAAAARLSLGRPTIAMELHNLVAAKVVRLEEARCQRLLVVPTDRLLTWAAEHIPQLAPTGSAS